MIKFGKSSGDLLSQKQMFFSNNEKLLLESQKYGQVYREQPRRESCKCCGYRLSGDAFIKQKIEYIFCQHCSHLNGVFEDTNEFCEFLYTEEGGAAYAVNYSAEDKERYLERVRGIYIPKAEFLRESLLEQGVNPEELKICDFGAGSGYFISALQEVGMRHNYGYEVSGVQANLANDMLGQALVFNYEMHQTLEIAENADADLISLIGVLEHLQNPREFLAAVARNKSVKYILISVPLFSPCVMVETVFPNVMQRQLSAGHTHLFTQKSLSYLVQEHGLSIVSEWWFGTDLVDIFRSVSVELGRDQKTSALMERWSDMIVPLIDEMQLSIDKEKMSSEVHMLLRF